MYTFKRLHIWQVSSFVVIALLAALLFALRASADSGRFFIDFGEANITTATGWNNVSGAQAKNTTTTIPLIDSTGAQSSATLRFTDGFNCVPAGSPVNANGTTGSSTYPATATRDSLYLGPAGGGICTQNDFNAAFTLGGLTANAKYEVKFYASRMGDTSNRTTNYTIGSTTVQLNATNNVNNTVTISGTTSATGTISVAIAKAQASAAFGYLGAIEVVKSTPPTVSAGQDQSITLPSHQVTLAGTASDSDGIASYAWSEVSAGGATTKTPGNATTTVTDLAAGTYVFRLTATDSSGSSATDDIVVTVNAQNFATCSPSKLAVLGSSTALGLGASPVSNGWVNRYAAYFQQLNANNTVANFAVSGYSIYKLLPEDAPRPEGRPASDPAHNITAALAANPDGIIVNLPSNEVAAGYPLAEIQDTFRVLYDEAQQAGVPIWITTTQPRNLDQAGREKQLQLKNWIQSEFGNQALDFWTVLANPDGTINAAYGTGDGVHVNNAGHQKLYNRVAGSNLLTTICKPAPVISDVNSAPKVSQKITWATDKPASSRVEYGTTAAYGMTTPELNKNPRVTAHEVTISELALCTTYHYRIHSVDATNADQISANATFKTPCSI